MLRILQGSGESDKIGNLGDIAKRAEKRQRDCGDPQTGAEYDLSQPETTGEMQIRLLGKEKQEADLLA